MVSKQEIEFVIRPDGEVEFTIKGVRGTGCEDIAKLFQDLGDKTGDRATAEYYEKQAAPRVSVRKQ